MLDGSEASLLRRRERHVQSRESFVRFRTLDGLYLAASWLTGPHAEARTACLSVTAYIHLMHPQRPLRRLDAEAETVIKELENDALSVSVVDGLHRVDRTAGA